MKTRNCVYVIGAGDHAKVIAEIIEQQGHRIAGFLDDNEAMHNQTFLGHPIVGSIASSKHLPSDGLVLAIGSNIIRRKLIQQLASIKSDLWLRVVHPSAVVAPSASIGHGSMIVAGAVLNPDARVGNHCIINTGATVDHDCVIGDYAHIAPGVNLAGGVKVGEGALIGIGACVLPGITIGDWAIVGAGACVIRPVPAGITVVGVPAKPLIKRSKIPS
jgi:sugar O-acyltransferase (sialic acid O-acetyltransferase NeuD family)